MMIPYIIGFNLGAAHVMGDMRSVRLAAVRCALFFGAQREIQIFAPRAAARYRNMAPFL